MSSDQEAEFASNETEARSKIAQDVNDKVAKIEEKLKESSSYIRDVTKFLNPMATSSPLSRSHYDINELKMHLQTQDKIPSRSEPYSFCIPIDQHHSKSEKNSSSSDREDVPSILKKKKSPTHTPVDNVKEIKVYQSGGVLILQQGKEQPSNYDSNKVSDISAKLMEDCLKLSEGLKEVDDKTEGKVVQFDLTPEGSPFPKNYFSESPLATRNREQPSSLSTNDSLPWQQPVGLSSPSSTASARRLEWDSGADIGYLNLDASKEKLSTIEKLTLQGIAKDGAGKKRVVYKTSLGDRVLERIPSEVLELEEKKPLTQDAGTSPRAERSDADSLPKNLPHSKTPQTVTSEETEETLQETETGDSSPADHPPKNSSDGFKDKSIFVNTLGSDFDSPPPNRIKSSPKQRRKKASPKLKKHGQSPVSKRSGKIREILELARAGNSESESRVEELIVDHSYRGEVVSQNIGRCGLTSASSGSNITVLSKPEEKVTYEDKPAQTSARTYESKGIQAAENVSPKLMSCKSVQASGELNSLPKHLDARKNSAMSGQEVRTKSTQFFGEGANSLPKALDKANRVNKTSQNLKVYVAHIKENKEKTPEPIPGPSGINAAKSSAQSGRDNSHKSPGKTPSKSKGSNSSKSYESSGKSGELTIESLRHDTVDPSILQKKFFDSQKKEVNTKSTSMDRAFAEHGKETIGIQYSPRNETLGGRKTEGNVRDMWTDTIDSQASSTQTAHSWVHEGAPRRHSVVRPTRSFEYLPGEVYESSANLRETLPSETSQNVITESSSSESEPPRPESHSEGGGLSATALDANEGSSDVGGGTVVLENSDSEQALHAGAVLVVSDESVMMVNMTRRPAPEIIGISEESLKSSVAEDSLRKRISSIAIQTEALINSKDSSHRGDESLKRMIRNLCEILLNERRSRHHSHESRSLDRNTLLSLRDRSGASNYSDARSVGESTYRKPQSAHRSEYSGVAGVSSNAGAVRRNENPIDSRDSNEADKYREIRRREKEKRGFLVPKPKKSTLEKHKTLTKGSASAIPDASDNSNNGDDKRSLTLSTIDSEGSIPVGASDEKSLRGKKDCRCHLKSTVKNGKKVGMPMSDLLSKCPSSNEQSSEKSEIMLTVPDRACSTPYTHTSNDGTAITATSGTPTYSSCPSASGETSGSNLTSKDQIHAQQTRNMPRLPKAPSKPKEVRERRGKSAAAFGVGADTQWEHRMSHQATQVSGENRLSSESHELNDKATQLSGSSLCYCHKCRSDSCSCFKQADVGTQMSNTSRSCSQCKVKCTCEGGKGSPENSSSSSEISEDRKCRKCISDPCICCKRTSPDVNEKADSPSSCCSQCKRSKCACAESLRSNSVRACRKCGSESCNCLLLILSPPNEPILQTSKSSKKCSKCNQNSCSCSVAVVDGPSVGKGLKVINGHHFGKDIVVDLSSSEPSSLSSGPSTQKSEIRKRKEEKSEETCTVCQCPSGIKQQCIFCPCHIDKNMHIPRCDCHEQSVPRFLLPGFCKCHKRNIEYFKECLCADSANSSNCPCCEAFYKHLRKNFYQKQMEKNMTLTKRSSEKVSPRNYFLKLEETEVSKDSSDVSDQEKKPPIEVITIKIPVKRCGKAKLASNEFYYAQSSQRSSENKEKEVEYLDDIIRKYTTKVSSEEVSERSKSNGTNGGSDTLTERNGTASGNSYRTLQEWLESNRPDFFYSAETRRKVIRQRVQEREVNKENRLERVINACPVQHTSSHLPARIFTTAQMKQQTLRKYKELFEVRKKKEDRKKNEEHRRNKLMADIFAKKLQLKTLRGQTIGEYEDCSCHVRAENLPTTCLYGIFDGNDGVQAANFALQRMAAEILLLSELNDKNSDEEVKEVLRQSFISVEKSYWESLDDKLAERTSVQCEIPEGLSPFEAYQKYPHLVDRLKGLNMELQCGTTAVVALIHQDRLYVANVGDSRALLCKTDSDGVLKVIQLSVDHDLRNEDEQLRLSNLGLQIDKIRQVSRIGNQECTRCIGNYLVKGGYKDLEGLANARSEPVIAEPDIHGGILLDNSCRFLLLMSGGLYKSLQVATGSPDSVNKDLAQIAVEQFREQSTLSGVAQSIVDKVARHHHDLFEKDGNPLSRDDITLIVRNFNYPLEKAMACPVNPVTSQVRFNPVVSTAAIEADDENGESDIASTVGDGRSTEDTTTTTTSENSDVFNAVPGQIRRIDPYVDFSVFYRNIEIALQNGTLPDCLR